MYSQSLNESQIIENIRRYGAEILNPPVQDSELDFELSDSESGTMDNLIRPMISLAPRSKKKLFKPKYAIDYSSPYSPNPTSRKKSPKRSSPSRNNSRDSSGRKIRHKIFEMYEEGQRVEKEKKELHQKTKDKYFLEAKPRYMQAEPLMKNLSGFIEKNIYGRIKTETDYISKKDKKVSRQEREERWSSFIKKSQDWSENRKSSIMKAKLDNSLKESQTIQIRPTRREAPPMGVNQCLQKLRRQADKLKQRLKEVSFQPNQNCLSSEQRFAAIERSRRKNSRQLAKSKFSIKPPSTPATIKRQPRYRDNEDQPVKLKDPNELYNIFV